MIAQWSFTLEKRKQLVGDDSLKYFQNTRGEGNLTAVVSLVIGKITACLQQVRMVERLTERQM